MSHLYIFVILLTPAMKKNKLAISLDNPKDLILLLIQADMRNSRLIGGLNKAGALIENFDTDLAFVVFTLIGFKERDDSLYTKYFRYLERLNELDLSVFLDKQCFYAFKLYQILIKEKEKREMSTL